MSSGLYSGQPGLSLGTGLYRTVSGLWSGASGLAMAFGGAGMPLSLNFLTMTAYTLDPRITFSRGSQAMVTDATGKLTYAPNNLLTNSESFEAAYWTKSNSSVSANVTAAPNGTSTADKLVENTAASVNHFMDGSANVVGIPIVYSVYAKAAGRSFLQLTGGGFGAQGNTAIFNLSNGTMFANLGNKGGIVDAGNGWYRCYIAFTPSTTGSIGLYMCDNTGNPSYTGDGTSGIFFWGAQLEAVTYQTTPSPYVSTTPKNLLGYTQEFDNAAWTKTSATVIGNSMTAPDGSLTADTINANAGAAGAPRVSQAPSTVGGQPYTISAYFKANGTNFAFLSLRTASVDWAGAEFNLVTGVVNRTPSNGTVTFNSASITPVGNGWYRCSVTVTPAAVAQFVIIGSSDGSGAFAGGYPSFTNAGTETVYIWGAQLSNSASLTPYVYNPVAAPSSTAYYGPRFDYNPVTLLPRGLLVEEQRTNLQTYSQGAFNTQYTKVGTPTVSDNSAAGIGGPSTASAVTGAAVGDYIYRDATTVIGTQYARSIYVSNVNATQSRLVVRSASSACDVYLNWSGATLSSLSTSIGAASFVDCGNGIYRVILIYTALETTDRLRITPASVAGLATINIYGAQLEAGAFATSYIPTAASTVTRSADVALMQGANFSQWYNGSQGSFVVEASTFAPSGAARSLVQSVATTNGHFAYVHSSNAGGIFDGTNLTITGNTITVGTPFKLATAYSSAGLAACLGGGTVATGASYNNSFSASTAAALGNFLFGGFTNGYIRSISYYNTRLPNLQLQALTQ